MSYRALRVYVMCAPRGSRTLYRRRRRPVFEAGASPIAPSRRARTREPDPATRPYESQEANLHARLSIRIERAERVENQRASGKPGIRTPLGH